ncbi:M48 family metalloprotease [Mesorhizobium sp. M0955]|uniref:M48 family metalloprotease n=1 Tax=Mesorhizobium sp. M0955 TaxID=2957033 RepID=UPI003339963E
MRLATSIFGTETRVRPLVTALLAITALRVGWLAINIYEIYDPHVWSLAWALVPWPWPMGSWAVWTAELALVFYQARAALRLGRLLALRYTPRAAAFLGLSGRREGDHLTPRNRSWLPTALQLSGTLILTCCVAYWITLMLWFWEWCPLDPYMQGFYGQRALVAGVVLSLLGLTFGGRYIARASADVSTSFRVVSVGDDHWLAQRVHQLSDQLSLPRPAVGITNVLNAFAMGKNQRSSMVVIGTPLFEYEKDELDAVIGHELGHILHNDIARMTFAEGFQRMLVTVVDIITVVGAIMAAQDAKTPSDAQRNVRLVKGSGHLARKTVFIASELVTQGISRNREFHADVVGAHVTSPDAMARALKRVHGVAEKPTPEERHYGYLMFRGAGFGNLFSTHPTLQARLKALDARTIAQQAAAKPAEYQATVAIPEGVQGLVGAGASGVAPAPVWAKLGAITSDLARWVRSGSAALRAKVNTRRLLIVGAACVALAVVAPAIVNFYALDRRFDDTRVSAGHALSSSWGWMVATKEAWFGDASYAERVRQLDAREQAVKAAEAALAAAPETARTRVVAPSVDSATLAAAITDRDNARAEAKEMQQKLDAANVERSARPAVASQPDGQRQVATLSDQLAKMTADRDEMTHRNDVLRDMNLELKGQIATRDIARVGLDKQIQDLQTQIASLTTSPSEDPAQVELPTVRPTPPGRQGGYGAFAVAGNGTVILTDRSFASEQEAADAALAECGQFSGGSQCVVRQTFRNTCAAVARVIPVTKRSRYELQLEPTIEDAEEMALSECFQRNGRPCEVTRQVCVR